MDRSRSISTCRASLSSRQTCLCRRRESSFHWPHSSSGSRWVSCSTGRFRIAWAGGQRCCGPGCLCHRFDGVRICAVTGVPDRSTFHTGPRRLCGNRGDSSSGSRSIRGKGVRGGFFNAHAGDGCRAHSRAPYWRRGESVCRVERSLDCSLRSA